MSDPAGRAWRFGDLALPAMALAFMTAVRCNVGPVLALGFVPIIVGPVAAAFLPFRAWGSFCLFVLAIALAVSAPLIGLDTVSVWAQLFELNVASVAACAFATASLSPLRLRAVTTGSVAGWDSASSPLPTPSQAQTDLLDKTFSTSANHPAPLPPPPPARGGGEEAFAQTAVVLAWLAWLTWPIWLANAWSPLLDHLLTAQPLNAAGSVLIHLGDWTHQPIAYTYLLNLGQDVPYAPAASAWPAILLHGGVAIGGGLLLKWRLSRRPAAGG